MSQIRLEKWKIFDSLSDQVKRSIRLARVFPTKLATEYSSPPTSALYVTAEDEVFASVQILNGCDTIPYLTTRTQQSFDPSRNETYDQAHSAFYSFEEEAMSYIAGYSSQRKIDVLCGQNMHGLEISKRNSIFAISSLGSVFAWGANDHGQLGLGTNQDTIIPTKISGILEGKKVVQVACGESHTLALTSEGQVFAFGHNQQGQLGLGNNVSTNMPAIVEGPLAGRFVTAIACQSHTSVALLDSGEAFAWGLNNNGIMAIEMNQQQKIPVKVSGLEGVTISKISCGHGHTLALSTNGKVYSWQNKQINSHALFGARMESFLPEIISSAIGRFIDIAAFSDASAALTESNQIYIWGRHGIQMIPRPTITSFSSLDEVFAPNTFRPLRPNELMMTPAPDAENEQLTDTLNDCLKQAFNDLETADFAFVVDGKKIHVHKTILILRCVVFKTMFLGDWKECHTNEHTIEGHSFDAVYALLKYFYTDELDVQPEKALECLNLAHFYQLKGLQTKCVRLIKSGVTAENAASIYDKALVFGSKELEDFVFRFCLRNMTAVVKSDGFKKLSEKVTSDFLQRVAEQGGFKS